MTRTTNALPEPMHRDGAGRRRRLALSGLALMALVLLSACGDSADKATSDPAALTGVEWTLAESSMSSVDLSAAGITATFDGTRVSGFSGVNQYGGSYTAGTDGSLKISEIASTQMAGPEPQMRAEQAYLTLLQACDSYAVVGGRLTLSTGTQETLIYDQAKPAELPGSKWLVTGYNNGKQAVTSPDVGSELTIDFGTDGTVGGTGGVNTYNGPFTVSGTTVKIGPLAATEMAGPKDLMTQETAFLAALQNSSTWAVVRGQLEMRDADGATQITAKARP